MPPPEWNSARARIDDALLGVDPVTAEHSGDVELLVGELCARLGVNGDEREAVLLGARLHDVGKSAVPRKILEKPGPLDDDEWDVMHSHTITGEEILRDVPELEAAAPLVRSSHERFDGTGYPDGLAGEAIPLGSRIIFCADAFHAIRSDRPYRKGRTTREAIAEITANSGTQFDPKVIDALIESVAFARAFPRRRLPPRLALLFATLILGTGGAYAAERGLIPSPIPGFTDEVTVDAESGEIVRTSATETLTGSVAANGDTASASGADGSGTSSAHAIGRDGSADGSATIGSVNANVAARPGGGHANGAASLGSGSGAGGAQQAGDGAGGTGSGGGSSGETTPGNGRGTGAPGNSANAPGHTGSNPGQSGSAPGQSGSNPGHGGSPPGQSGSSPGQSGATPGQSGSSPGNSGSPPGQSGSSPGNSGSAPGQTGTPPGQSVTPPGQASTPPGQPSTPPGQSGTPPGNSGNAPGQGGTGGNPHA